MANQSDNWKTEAVKQIPWSAPFLVASFCFFHDNNAIVGWMCFVVAVIALFLLIKFKYYESIIDRQEKQIEKYNKHVIDVQKNATDNLSRMHAELVSPSTKYQKDEQVTSTE